MRLHELMKAVCALGPSRLLLLNPVDQETVDFVSTSIETPVIAVRVGVVSRRRALVRWVRHPSLHWRVVRADRNVAARQIQEHLDQFSPDLIWTTSILGWLALPKEWRSRAAIDLIDGISTGDMMLAFVALRRWRRRLFARVRGRAMSGAPPTSRFKEFLRDIDGAIRGPGLERMLARHALTLVVSHAPNRRYRRMLIVPNGFDETPAAAATDSGNVTFFFPANFRYEPNLDGGEWFIESILPILRRTVDDPVVAFAGQCREGFQAYGAKNGVRVVGPFDRLSALVDDATVIIVPLLGGTGTRLKILEAWSMGLPVVSTSVGAEGLGAEDRNDILLADTPTAFAKACAELWASPELRKRIAAGGAHTAERFRWAQITDDLRAELRSRTQGFENASSSI